MEKITLKPAARELLYKNNEPGICFDVTSYSGATAQERNLGSLYVLSQLKQREEDLDYLVSLTSSLAKREYYSQEALIEQNPKAAFERTLKKLNEILTDFFKNKNLIFNIGLAVIAGDTIYISRLGKFKVALARDGEYIDILNNIQLFSKDNNDEKQFANIISGKLRGGDKIFAYFPQRAIGSREKLLNPIFINQGQEEFSNKLAQLAANVNNFSCCGIHIDIKEIKEIPVEATSANYQVLPSNWVSSSEFLTNNQKSPESAPTETNNDLARKLETKSEIEPELASVETKNIPKPIAAQSAIKAEVSFAKRGNIISNTIDKVSQFIAQSRTNRAPKLNDLGEPKPIKIGESPRSGRLKFFAVTAIIVILPIMGWAFIKNRGSTQTKNTINKAQQLLSRARSSLAQNNPKEARNLLNNALAEVGNLDSKQTDGLRIDINRTLDSVDHASDKQPELLYNSKGSDLKFKQVVSYGDGVGIVNENGNLLYLTSGEPNEIGQFKKTGQFLFADKNYIDIFDGTSSFEVYNSKTKKISVSSLKNDSQYQDAVIYENNLYALKDGKIYKYNDVITGDTKGTSWGDVSESGSIIALTVDGNVYVLNSDGKISKYFRGKKDGELDLQIVPPSTSKITTYKDSPIIYLTDSENKKVFVFNKSDGSLKTSYKLNIVGDIQDISISPNSTILILSKTNNIWQVKP